MSTTMLRTTPTMKPIRHPRNVPMAASSSVTPSPRIKSAQYFSARNAAYPKNVVGMSILILSSLIHVLIWSCRFNIAQ